MWEQDITVLQYIPLPHYHTIRMNDIIIIIIIIIIITKHIVLNFILIAHIFNPLIN